MDLLSQSASSDTIWFILGWFYHAPAKMANREQVIPPPPSQIPGLSNLPDEGPEENRNKMWIKDTDSPYIKLAKQGGRPDLLRYM